MSDQANQYEIERRDKRQKLRDLGLDPYGQRTPGIQPLLEVKQLYKTEFGHDSGPLVKVAGRVMLKRDMGKLSFLTLRDDSGDLQVALDKKRLSEADWEVRNLIDLGDQIVVEGPLGSTNKGETTVWSTSLSMASKAMLPPPAKWEGLSDVEARYRQRYVDLWANPEVMRTMQLRMRIVDEIRIFMRARGFLEVETPMMQIMHGGAAARPFETHHNALDLPLFMRIAPELYLKRLLVGGFRKVFELNRNFRNEGISPRHNPEFTMLEAYEAFGSWETMADMVEEMITTIAQNLLGTLRIDHCHTEGMDAVNAYSEQNEQSLSKVCHARLMLLYRNASLRNQITDSEREALQTASEGIEHGQSGFDNYVKETKHALQNKSTDEQRKLLSELFVIRSINLSRPWRRVKMTDLVAERTGWKFTKQSLFNEPQSVVDGVISALADRTFGDLKERGPTSPQHMHVGDRLKADVLEKMAGHLKTASPAEQLVEVYEKLIEHTLIDPCFVTHVPSVVIPLARPWKEDPFFADVYELAINGQEISPGYTELNDPDVQEAQFGTQVGDDAEKQKVDHDFLNALKYGMPPAGGMGMGIDRLVMMLLGAESIRDVILFPLMRPQE